MKHQLLLLFLFYCVVAKGQTDAPLNVPAVGHGATTNSSTFRFGYNGLSVGHYGLGWYNEDGGSPVGYLSGYAGLKFFTTGYPRMTINDAGNVGIGTTKPTNTLALKGIALGTSNDTGIDFSVVNGTYEPIYARIALGVGTATLNQGTGYLSFSTLNSGTLIESMRLCNR